MKNVQISILKIKCCIRIDNLTNLNATIKKSWQIYCLFQLKSDVLKKSKNDMQILIITFSILKIA